MELFLENCLTIDFTTPITSPRRQIPPVLVDEDSGLGMEMVSAYSHYFDEVHAHNTIK